MSLRKTINAGGGQLKNFVATIVSSTRKNKFNLDRRAHAISVWVYPSFMNLSTKLLAICCSKDIAHIGMHLTC